MQQLPVSALMRVCPDAIIAEQTSLRMAAEILIRQDFPALIACDANGRLAGVVPETAVVRELMSTSSRDETVAGIVARHAESVRPDAALTSVLHLFRSSCHCVLPVIGPDCQVIGLLHRQDVVRYLLSDSDETGLPANSDAAHSTSRQPYFLKRAGQRSESRSEQF
jgi:CBS-domain-containing membrane protein